MVVDTKDLVSELDGADLFLRDRCACSDLTLNKYDVEILQDAAKTCDKAARLLEKSVVVPFNVGDVLYFINNRTNKIETDTVKFITVTKNGAKPILERHNTRFWEHYIFGVNVFWTEAEAEERLKIQYDL